MGNSGLPNVLFQGERADCVNIVVYVRSLKPGVVVNAADMGTDARQEPIWISSEGKSACIDAVGLW